MEIYQGNSPYTASLSKTASLLEIGSNVYLSQSYISSVTGSSSIPYRPATMWWDDDNKTYSIYTDHSGVSLQLGQEQWLRSYAGESVSNGDVVYISGSLNNLPVIMKAIADGTGQKHSVVGIVTENISSGSIGIVTTQGQIHDLDTSIYTDSFLYLSPTIAGKMQTSAPIDPYEKVIVGYVISKDASNGIIQVDISNMGQNFYPYVGVTQIPSMTVNSSSATGSIFTVGTGRVNLCTTSDGMGKIVNYEVSPSTFTITSSFIDALFLVATYNSGSPVYQLQSSNRQSIDSIQTTIIYTVLNGEGGTLVSASWDAPGVLLSNKNYLRVQSLRGVEREIGCELQTLSSTNSAYIVILSGSVWHGMNRENLSPINSSGSRTILVAHSASVWSGSRMTEVVYNRYDNGTNLASMDANKFVCNWVYRTDVNTNATLVLLGPQYEKLSDAISSQPPTIPTEMNEYSFLTGRVICKNTTSQATRVQQVDSAYVVSFVSVVTDHNSLLGLQGGTTDQYYHLTAAEYSSITTGSVQNIAIKSASYALTNDDYTIIMSGSTNLTASLPSSGMSVGQIYNIKLVTPHTLFITGSNLIDNVSNWTVTEQYTNVTLQFDGSHWWIL